MLPPIRTLRETKFKDIRYLCDELGGGEAQLIAVITSAAGCERDKRLAHTQLKAAAGDEIRGVVVVCSGDTLCDALRAAGATIDSTTAVLLCPGARAPQLDRNLIAMMWPHRRRVALTDLPGYEGWMLGRFSDPRHSNNPKAGGAVPAKRGAAASEPTETTIPTSGAGEPEPRPASDADEPEPMPASDADETKGNAGTQKGIAHVCRACSKVCGPTPAPRVCPKCQSARYCSRSCQRGDAKRHAKRECRAAMMPGTDLRIPPARQERELARIRLWSAAGAMPSRPAGDLGSYRWRGDGLPIWTPYDPSEPGRSDCAHALILSRGANELVAEILPTAADGDVGVSCYKFTVIDASAGVSS